MRKKYSTTHTAFCKAILLQSYFRPVNKTASSRETAISFIAGILNAPEKNTFTMGKIISAPEEIISTPEEIISSREALAFKLEEIIARAKETTYTVDPMILSSEETVSTTEEIASYEVKKYVIVSSCRHYETHISG